MTHYKSYTVVASDVGTRVDSLCAQRGLFHSRSAAAKALDAGRVLINGASATKKQVVSSGDVLVYEVDDTQEDAAGLIPEAIPLDIRFEDDHLLVLSKQAGLVCHPSIDHHAHTLVHALLAHCGKDHLCSVQGENDRLGIVHRLDRDTTGLMLAAKDDETGYALMQAIRDKAVERRYLALVHGIIAPATGMIDAPLARSPRDRTRMAVSDGANARTAITTFSVLERFYPGPRDNGYTLIDCKLFTGRTHQIRVHMEHIKHPLVGDPVYCTAAPRSSVSQCGLTRQFLHSFHLVFDHPVTGEQLCFEDELPQDLAQVLNVLRRRSE